MGKSPSCDKDGLKKGPWTAEEDQKLLNYIQKHGHGRWRILPKNAGLKRCGKSCRLRWTNYLRPDIKRGKFSFEEEEAIIQLHGVLGNKWSTIAARLPGRTDNEIKNYWNTRVKKRLLRMGIDPVTHNPCLDLLQLYSLLNSSLHSSSQPNSAISSLLGIGPMLNPDVASLLTSFLSCQGNVSQDQLGCSNLQDQHQFQCLQPNNLQNQIQACKDTSSSAQVVIETQPNKGNLEQLWGDPTNFSCQGSLQKLWQANGEAPKISEGLISTTSFETLPSLNFSSLLSTPSCSTTPLHSSSTSNYYVNGSIEDERDSYCSNMMMFDIPCSLDGNSLM